MNVQHEPGNEQTWLTARLAGLPDPEPPAPLLGRILASRSRRRRQRQWGAAAAALLGAVLIWPLLRPADLPEAPAVVEAPMNDDLELLLIDRRLQAAYDRGASAEQVEALWLARARRIAAGSTPTESEETRDATHILSL